MPATLCCKYIVEEHLTARLEVNKILHAESIQLRYKILDPS
jgi:hypothetical protein